MQGRALPADRGRPPPRERESPGKPESRRRPDSRREPESPRLFMEGCFDAMLLLDTRGRVLDANSAASVMVGRPVAGMRGKTVGALVGLRRHAADKDGPARRDITELEGTLCTLRRADHADLTVVLRKAEDGAGRQIWVLRDVTQSRPIADALERKARLLMEAERVGRMGAWELDIHTGLVIWTAELQRLMEVEESGVLTVEESNTFYTGPSRAIVREAFKATMNHGTPYDLELEVVTGHGRRMWVRETCRPSFRNGRLSSLVGVLQDISERRRMADLLAKRADIERERIGADLHDGLGQELTGLALLLEAAATRQRRLSAGLAEELTEIGSVARKAIQTLREVTHRMLPLELRQLGFNCVCRQLADSTQKALGVVVRFRYVGERSHVPAGAAAEHLFRIAQEAISNAIKHGGSTRIALTLRGGDTKLVFTISDDGRGIDVRKAAAGIGLETMRYRAHLLGGFLDIERTSRGGTRVRCVVPTAQAG